MDSAINAAYLGRLAHCYVRMSHLAVAHTATSLVNQGRLLQGMLGDDAPQQLNESIASLAGQGGASPRPETIGQALLAMQQVAGEAIAQLSAVVEHREAAVARYDRAVAAFEHQASTPRFVRDAVSLPIEQYAQAIPARLEAQIDSLMKNRYDALVFRQMLVDKVVDRDALVKLLEDLISAQTDELCDGWRGVAERHAVSWPKTLPSSNPGVDEVVNQFIKPIQLFYERPGVIRSAFGLGRGKFQEKLTSEVDEGVANLTRAALRMVESEWRKVAEHCRHSASSALEEWIRSSTGNDREGCLREAAAARAKIESLQDWLEGVKDLGVARWFASQREPLRRAAAVRIVSRLQQV